MSECRCGCGEETPIAQRANWRGIRKGDPLRYVPGHYRARQGNWEWTVKDQGFASKCWLWKGAVDKNGRGRKQINGKHMRAYRALYEQLRGPIPAGLTLDHLCRVPLCVNPDHLEPVTQAENNRRGKAKLSVDQVRAIRATKGPRVEIARQFGISPGHVSQIRRKVRWADV